MKALRNTTQGPDSVHFAHINALDERDIKTVAQEFNE